MGIRRLFDAYSASIEQGPAAIAQLAAQALLVALGVAFPGAVGRGRLIGILWAKHSQVRARHSLRQTLSELRRDVPSLIVARGDALVLGLVACTVDVAAFREFAAVDDAARVIGGQASSRAAAQGQTGSPDASASRHSEPSGQWRLSGGVNRDGYFAFGSGLDSRPCELVARDPSSGFDDDGQQATRS